MLQLRVLQHRVRPDGGSLYCGSSSNGHREGSSPKPARSCRLHGRCLCPPDLLPYTSSHMAMRQAQVLSPSGLERRPDITTRRRNARPLSRATAAFGKQGALAHDADEWVEGEALMRRRQQVARERMQQHDNFPPVLREVSNGLPRPDYLPWAVADGAASQEDAEEWMRAQFGSTVVG